MASFVKRGNRWDVFFYFQDWTGKEQRSCKRGFATKREAKDWYEDFALNKADDLTMSFGSLVDTYLKDMSFRLKENTLRTKRVLIDLKILPYFKDRPVASISAADIRKWQSMLMSKGYKPTYLKCINNQLSAIFNYAVKFYDLKASPALRAGSMGSKNGVEKSFWTVDEFNKFSESLYKNIHAYIGFKLLFWTGIRIGELLALTKGAFNLEEKTMAITRSYQRIDGKDVITSPKTEKSTRVVGLPAFLVDDLRDFFERLYECKGTDRVFPFTKYFFEHAMKSGCKASGVRKIRLHDLRHSHASMLVNLGVGAKVIADRLGHERIETTLNTYSHLYKSTQDQVLNNLEAVNAEAETRKES